MTGHSVGGVLTCLVAMLPSPYKAAAALEGNVDMENFAAFAPQSQVPYDRNATDEIRVRNPLAFATSIQCPLQLYVSDRDVVNQRLAERARAAGKPCELIRVKGDHHAMVAPAVQKTIIWFRDFNNN